MTCIHLQQLYKLCQEHDLKLGSSDLVRVVCQKCGEKEVCPSTMMDEYDSEQSQSATEPDDESVDDPAKN
jgi:hypothetical protein